MGIFQTIQKVGQAVSKTLMPEKQNRDVSLGGRREASRDPIKREQETGIFGSHSKINRPFMVKSFRKAPDRVEGGGKLKKPEKIALAEEVFPQEKYGYYITRGEWRRGMRHLVKSGRRLSKPTERMKLRTKIKFLGSIEGEEGKK